MASGSAGAQVRDQVPVRIGGPGADLVRDLKVDRRGSILAGGQFEGTVDFDPSSAVVNRTSAGDADAFTAKYDRFGRLEWVVAFGGLGADTVRSLSTDSQGNVFVAGSFSGNVDFDPGPATASRTSRGARDIFLVRLTADGQFSWVITMGDTANDEAMSIATDANGTVYVAGYFEGSIDIDPGPLPFSLFSVGGSDAFLVKYQPNGTLEWGFPLGNVRPDQATAVAVDRNGDVLLGGSFDISVDFDPGDGARILVTAGGADAFVAKYTPDGRAVWSAALGGPADDALHGLATGDGRDIWAAGVFRETADFDPGPLVAARTSAGATDAFVVGLTPTGALLSAVTFGGPGDDAAVAVHPEPAAVNVTGSFSRTADFDPSLNNFNVTAAGTAGATDLFLARYSRSGDLLWVRTLGAATAGFDRATSGSALAVDLTGNLLLAGSFFETIQWTGANPFTLTSAGSSDGLLARFDTSGNPVRLPGEEPSIAAVTSAANGLPGPVSALSIFTLWGSQLTGSTATYSGLPLPQTLCSIRIGIADGAARETTASLYFCSPGQIVLQAPAGLAPGQGRITVYGQGNSVIASTPVTIVESSPGIFVSGTTPAIVIGAGPRAGQLANVNNPALPGECLLIYATGLGAVSPTAQAGELVAALHRVTEPVTVGIGQRILPVDFAGLAPGGPGAYQVNVCLPPDLAPDSYDLTVRQRSLVSNVVRIGVSR